MKNINFSCPECYSELREGNNSLKCSKCKEKYAIESGIPIFIPSRLENFKEKEMRFHDKHSEKYDEAHNLESKKIQFIHEDFLKYLSSLPKKALVLEAGCGTGKDLVEIREKGFRAVGFDISRKMVEETGKKLKEKKFNDVKVFVGDAERIPFENELFDSVVMVATLHHLKNNEKGIREMSRVLKKGGTMIIGSEPNSWPYYFKKVKHSRVGRKIVSFFRKDYNVEEVSIGDETTEGFKEKELRKLFERNGLKVVKYNYVLFLSGFLLLLKINLPKAIEKALLSFDALLLKIPLVKRIGWHVNIVLRKE
ncbi:MAG: methyltransferase domain-containing protein [archaeon]